MSNSCFNVVSVKSNLSGLDVSAKLELFDLSIFVVSGSMLVFIELLVLILGVVSTISLLKLSGFVSLKLRKIFILTSSSGVSTLLSFNCLLLTITVEEGTISFFCESIFLVSSIVSIIVVIGTVVMVNVVVVEEIIETVDDVVVDVERTVELIIVVVTGSVINVVVKIVMEVVVEVVVNIVVDVVVFGVAVVLEVVDTSFVVVSSSVVVTIIGNLLTSVK